MNCECGKPTKGYNMYCKQCQEQHEKDLKEFEEFYRRRD